MGRTELTFFQSDAIEHLEMTEEEREEELKRLKEESDKLTEWLPM